MSIFVSAISAMPCHAHSNFNTALMVVPSMLSWKAFLYSLIG